VTGEVIPSLEKIEEVIEKSLTLSNPCWPRWVFVKGVALALHRWAREVGLERARLRGQMILEGQEMKYADLANLPWVPMDQVEPLSPEQFAERLGGIVDELERTGTRPDGGRAASEDDDGGDRQLLQGSGPLPEGGGAGGEPGHDGQDGGDGEPGDDRSQARGRVLAFPTRRRDPGDEEPEGFSRRLVVQELREHEKDLKAFQDAYGCIHRRLQEIKDDGQFKKLLDWAGTSAVSGSLQMSIHAIEQIVKRLRRMLVNIDRGVVPNLDED
jgi:hypothetical protein